MTTVTDGGGRVTGIWLVLRPKIDPQGRKAPNKASPSLRTHHRGSGTAPGNHAQAYGRLTSRNCAIFLIAAHVLTRVGDGRIREPPAADALQQEMLYNGEDSRKTSATCGNPLKASGANKQSLSLKLTNWPSPNPHPASSCCSAAPLRGYPPRMRRAALAHRDSLPVPAVS